ncbi:hypothetical protein LDENG_00094830 [Lucifuga dentata]|nr:hypothetical protein LDENG_00094830 [Lucifuga dentata]
MGSYNYLGFAENNADFLTTVADKTCDYGVGVCSTRQEIVSTKTLRAKKYHNSSQKSRMLVIYFKRLCLTLMILKRVT